MKTTILEECGSTNTEARDRQKYSHGDAIIALRQTAGRGQRGHAWDSTAGENLTFSIVLEPLFLPVHKQFLLSETVALAVADTLALYGLAPRIKWTNDIYVGDRKICGILLEHDLSADHISRTIAGIGLNINQTQFPEWLPNPTSMALLAGRKFDIMEVFERFAERFWERYSTLSGGNGECGSASSEERNEHGRAPCGSLYESTAGNTSGSNGEESISRDYNALLYRLDRSAAYFIPFCRDIAGTSGRGVAIGTSCQRDSTETSDSQDSAHTGVQERTKVIPAGHDNNINNPDNSRCGNVEGIIRGVEPTGALIVEIGGRLEKFLFREIEFII